MRCDAMRGTATDEQQQGPGKAAEAMSVLQRPDVSIREGSGPEGWAAVERRHCRSLACAVGTGEGAEGDERQRQQAEGLEVPFWTGTWRPRGAAMCPRHLARDTPGSQTAGKLIKASGSGALTGCH